MKRKSSPASAEDRRGGQFMTGKPIIPPVHGQTQEVPQIPERPTMRSSIPAEKIVSNDAVTPEVSGLTGLALFNSVEAPATFFRVLGAHPKADGGTVVIVADYDFEMPSTLPRDLIPQILKPLLAVLAGGHGTEHMEVQIRSHNYGLDVRPFSSPVKYLALNYSPPVRQTLQTVYRWGGNRYPQIAEVLNLLYEPHEIKSMLETTTSHDRSMFRFEPLRRVNFQLERISENIFHLRNFTLILRNDSASRPEFVMRNPRRRGPKTNERMAVQSRPLFAGRLPILAAYRRAPGRNVEILVDRPEGISHVHGLPPQLLLDALQSLPAPSQMRKPETVNSRPLPHGVAEREITIQRAPFALVINHRYSEPIGLKTVGKVRKGSKIFFALREGRNGYSRFSFGVEVLETHYATFVVGFESLQGFTDVGKTRFDLPRHHFGNILTAHTGLPARREYWKVKGTLSAAELRESVDFWLGNEDTASDRGNAFYPVPGTYDKSSIVRIIGGRKAELEFLRTVAVRYTDKSSEQE